MRAAPLSQSKLEELRREQQPAAAEPAPPAQTPHAAGLTRLQQGAGNAAVGRMLSRTRARPQGAQLARYDSFEHAKAGDKAPGSQKVQVAGQTVTSGELNALADLYGSPAELQKADPKELAAVLVLVRRQVAGGKVAESEWITATNGRYKDLALKNSPHFGPSDPALVKPAAGAAAAGPDNRSMFLKYYADTLSALTEAALANDPAAAQAARDRAVVTAGFGEHYLMDAFSAGHLFNKDDFLGRLRENMGKLDKAKLDILFASVAKGVLADKASKALLSEYEPTGYVIAPNFDKQFALEGLLSGLYKEAEGKAAIESGLVKAVHDELSTRQAGGGLQGVEVKNKSETWILSGDRTLGTSPDTQRIIEQTLVQFRTIVANFKAAPTSMTTPTDGADRVLDLLPVPTANSTKMIEALVDKTIDPASGMSKALIELMVSELQTIIDVCIAKGKVKKA